MLHAEADVLKEPLRTAATEKTHQELISEDVLGLRISDVEVVVEAAALDVRLRRQK